MYHEQAKIYLDHLLFSALRSNRGGGAGGGAGGGGGGGGRRPALEIGSDAAFFFFIGTFGGSGCSLGTASVSVKQRGEKF